MVPAPIFVLSGPPGAGKSSAARGLAQRFHFGMHIAVDDLRDWVVSGLAPPVPTWTEETSRQFHLARTASARVAALYARSGFVVALDDVLFPSGYDQSYALELPGLQVVRVLLLPDEPVAQQRNRERTSKNFDPAFLVDTIHVLHAEMSAADFAASGWTVINNSRQCLDETIDAILQELSDPEEP